MVERFHTRTLRHIALVAANLLRMDGYAGLRRPELEERALAHDLSKFDAAERDGYIWLTWTYHCKQTNTPYEPPADVEALIARSLRIHRERNAHHPEAHRSPDAMSVLDLVEMVCDWTAIAQEATGVGSARDWAEANIAKWHFSPSKRDFIFCTIDELDFRCPNRSPRLVVPTFDQRVGGCG